jgi:hypothetical protein
MPLPLIAAGVLAEEGLDALLLGSAAAAGTAVGSMALAGRPFPTLADVPGQSRVLNGQFQHCSIFDTGTCSRHGFDPAPIIPKLGGYAPAPDMPKPGGFTPEDAKPTTLVTPPAPTPPALKGYSSPPAPNTSILTTGPVGPIVPPRNGYGNWVPESNNGWSQDSIAYQDKICGPNRVGQAYEVDDCNFDGEDPLTHELLEAKGKYNQFLLKNKLEWKKFYRVNGKLAKLENQMKTQNELCVKYGTFVHWHWAEPRPAEMARQMVKEMKLSRIIIHYTPP